MSNLLDYLTDTRYDTFYDKPFQVLDILALTELAYLPFEDLVCYDFSLDKAIRLDQLAQNFQKAYKKTLPATPMATSNRLQLLDKLAEILRFKAIKVFGYVNDYNLESQKQFAAICYKIAPKSFLTVFRGTDDTIIGWKEDFHMTYMAEIPAQKAAKTYLEKVMSRLEGQFYVAGHSKGGNLAVYTSSQQVPALQERIKAVYSFDGPGVHQSVLESDGWKAIATKTYPIIPENSIVGMMLATPKNSRVVSSETFGIFQHNSFSWEVEGEDFIDKDQVSLDSLQTDQTLKVWTASLSDQELQEFFDLFFGIFIEAGILRFSDFSSDTLQKLQDILQHSQSISQEEKDMLNRLLRLLIDTRVKIWLDSRSFSAKWEQLKGSFLAPTAEDVSDSDSPTPH